ncbi:MAG: dephospho-CoA kinase, partial [Flavobacteriales bacterium]
ERIIRVQKRDNTTKELVKKRLDNQMSDGQRRTLADFEILNYAPHLLTQQVSDIHILLSQD